MFQIEIVVHYLGEILMKIIICEEDYSYIERIHSTLLKYTKMKGIHAEFTLTTRKPSSIIKYLQTDQAECYFISLDIVESTPAIELIKMIQLKNEQALITVLSTDQEKLNSLELNELAPFRKILKVEQSSMAEELKRAVVDVYQRLKSLNYFA